MFVTNVAILNKHDGDLFFLIHARVLLTSSYPYDIKFLEKFLLFGLLLWASLYWERAPAYADACRWWRRKRRRRWRQENWSSSLFSSSVTKSIAIPAGEELGVWLIIYYFYFEYILMIQRVPVKPYPTGSAARMQKINKTV